MLKASGTLIDLTPPFQSSAILKTASAGCDAPNELEALESNDRKCAMWTLCTGSYTLSIPFGSSFRSLLNLPLFMDMEW
jgi:hypothetical protein